MNLQTRILLPTIGLIVILLGVSGYLSYSQTRKSLEVAIHQNLEGEASALTRYMKTMFQNIKAGVARAGGLPLVQKFYEEDMYDKEHALEFSGFMKRISDTYLDIDVINLFDTKGILVTGADPSQIGFDASGEEYFKRALAGEVFLSSPVKATVLDYETNRRVEKAVMYMSQPMKKDGKIVGVICGVVSMSTFTKETVAPITIGKEGFAFIVGRDGLVAVHPRYPDRILNPSLSTIPVLKQMIQQGNGTMTYKNNRGLDVLANFQHEEVSGLTVVVQVDPDEVFSPLVEMRNIMFAVVAVAVLLGGAVVVIIVRPVIVALLQGVGFASRVAAGDLSGTLTVQRKDEIGKLADALRSIPESLKEIVEEYDGMAKGIESGHLDAEGNAARFSGEFAGLVQGTNRILSCFRTVLDSIPNPVIALGKDLRITYLNTAGRDIVGDGYKGKSCGETFAREDYGTASDAQQRAASSLRAVSGETRAHPRGKDLDVAYSDIPLLDNQGRLASMLEILVDVTQIKDTQRTIMEVAAEAHDISNRVAAASEELSSQVEEVSRGTDIQRDRAASTATAMEEMNATVLEVARSAGQASDQADSTRKKAEEGEMLVTRVIAAIRQVNTVARELEDNMQDLGKQAEAIGGVMNVITDIADQTNLLALNAAIEAARAGEAGRGFAVVADEVRKLAEKTMNATTEVGANIKGIQTSTAVNITRVGEAAKSVGEATELAGTSGTALHEILGLANNNSSLIASIATAAEEQSATSEEINRAVEEINRIASETASGMMESSSAVQEVAHMAQELKTLLERLQS